jgi:hypothetical protein
MLSPAGMAGDGFHPQVVVVGCVLVLLWCVGGLWWVGGWVGGWAGLCWVGVVLVSGGGGLACWAGWPAARCCAGCWAGWPAGWAGWAGLLLGWLAGLACCWAGWPGLLLAGLLPPCRLAARALPPSRPRRAPRFLWYGTVNSHPRSK